MKADEDIFAVMEQDLAAEKSRSDDNTSAAPEMEVPDDVEGKEVH